MPAVFTDHSLFGFEDASSILTNKLLQFCLSDVSHVICVSNTSKENTVLRASLDPAIVSVIPNAIVADQFVPDVSPRKNGIVTIVYAGRLAYRRGADLLVKVIPRICTELENVRFIIAGDGQKRVDFEQMREVYCLQDRVIMLGAVKHSEMSEKLFSKGDIYLNTTLTEAFCISIVEAACSGLLVVSTKVGGIPEVLPDHMIIFAEPTIDDLVNKVKEAVKTVRVNPIDRILFHNQVREMYSWQDVAHRTQMIYRDILTHPKLDLVDRFRRYERCGPWAGRFACVIVAALYMLWCVLEWIYPDSEIDLVPHVEIDEIVKAYECDTRKYSIKIKQTKQNVT
ncbi:hypothetical protein HK096_011396 [Nowakowskiella sp. JEL0078]|nr:hypothetical protein HK096_011396 [Nowakowskiella sp. JEL0078]